MLFLKIEFILFQYLVTLKLNIPKVIFMYTNFQ